MVGRAVTGETKSRTSKEVAIKNKKINRPVKGGLEGAVGVEVLGMEVKGGFEGALVGVVLQSENNNKR